MAWPEAPATISNGTTSDASQYNNLRTYAVALRTEVEAQLDVLDGLISGLGGGANITVSETEPVAPADNDVWIIPGGLAASEASSLTGTHPNLTLRPGAVQTTHLADGSVTASKLEASFIPEYVVKESDQTLTAATSAVAVDITDLRFGTDLFGAGTSWLVDGIIRYQAEATGDLKLQWSLPSGAVVYGSFNGTAKGASSLTGSSMNVADTASTDTDEGNTGGFGVTAADIAALSVGPFLVVMGATTGDCKIQGLQVVTNATKPIILANSVLRATQVSVT